MLVGYFYSIDIRVGCDEQNDQVCLLEQVGYEVRNEFDCRATQRAGFARQSMSASLRKRPKRCLAAK
jgi:hypothetical protein